MGAVRVAQLLLESGADLTARTEFQKTPLFVACGNGKLDVARFLLERGSNPNVRDKDGWTPLHSAVRCGYLDVTRLLLDSGADVNVHKADRWTPMHLASANGHLDTAKLLVGRGANIDSRNDDGGDFSGPRCSKWVPRPCRAFWSRVARTCLPGITKGGLLSTQHRKLGISTSRSSCWSVALWSTFGTEMTRRHWTWRPPVARSMSFVS
jgi:hypothetical protein